MIKLIIFVILLFVILVIVPFLTFIILLFIRNLLEYLNELLNKG